MSITGSHLFARALKREGVNTVFTIAGDHILPVLDVMEATLAPATAYNFEEWMQSLEDDAPEVEARNGDMGNCRLE